MGMQSSLTENRETNRAFGSLAGLETNLETKAAKIPTRRRGQRSEPGAHFPFKIFAKF